MNDRQVKLGIVGMGPRSTAWIQVAGMVKSCRVTALCDRFEALVRQRHQLATTDDKEARIGCFTEVDRMLKEADIDAVALVVAPEHNADLIGRCLEAGKHVIAEVPLALTLKDCWRIVLAVEKSGLKFQLGEQVRFAPWTQAWRKLVHEGALGKILYVEGQYLHGMGPVRDGKTACWQVHDVAITPDGTLYAGENDNPTRSGYLWEIKL